MVSVIIPAYNAELYIKKCLDSVLKQNYHDYEAIVINDGSTDSTLKIIEETAAKSDKISVCSKKNEGVSSARNAALNLAKGEYITFLDADDTLPENALGDLVSLMNDDVDFVIGSFNRIQFKTSPFTYKPTIYKNLEEAKKSFLEFNSFLHLQGAKLYRKEIIDSNNLRYNTSLSYGEDHTFNLTYVQYTTGKIVVTDKIVYNYYSVRNGLSTRYYPDKNVMLKNLMYKTAEIFGGIENMPEDFIKKHCSKEIRDLVDNYIMCLPRNEAVEKIAETFDVVYCDFTKDEILSEYFSFTQRKLIKEKKYKEFTSDYIKSGHYKVLWWKFKRNVKLVLTKLPINLS